MRFFKGVIVVGGATASGKSDLAINLAQKFNGELICSDSMQVYRKLDIGTAKPTLKEQNFVPHHQIDLIEPNENYSAGKYERDTIKIIEEIQGRGHQPIIVGGAGLYYRALMYGFSRIPDIPQQIRSEVKYLQLKNGTHYCWEKLLKHDPQSAKNLQPNDTSRILRSLEVYLTTGFSITKFQKQQPFSKSRYPFLAFAFEWDRSQLYDRINLRTKKMLKSGWVDEVRELLKNYSIDLKPFKSIGYQEIINHLKGNLNSQEMVEKIQQRTRRYAKRQLTWFRKEPNVEWVKPNDVSGVISKIKVYLEK